VTGGRTAVRLCPDARYAKGDYYFTPSLFHHFTISLLHPSLSPITYHLLPKTPYLRVPKKKRYDDYHYASRWFEAGG